MTVYNIKLRCCDDSTQVQYDLDPMQADLLRDIAFMVNKAAEEEHCKPSLVVWMDGDEEPYPYASDDAS